VENLRLKIAGQNDEILEKSRQKTGENPEICPVLKKYIVKMHKNKADKLKITGLSYIIVPC
jgi:hypothetical protein